MKDLTRIIAPDDKAICDLLMDQYGFAAIAVAHDVSLFEKLSGKSLPLNEISQELKTEVRSAEVLLNALLVLGFVTKNNELYSLTAVADSYLNSNSEVSRISQLMFSKNSWLRKKIRRMIQQGIDPVVQGEASLSSMWQTDSLTDEASSQFTQMMDTNISALAINVARSSIFDEFTSVVDVGGASGIFLAAMKQHHPKMSLTLFELALVCESAKKMLAQYIDIQQIDFFAGNFFENKWPLDKDAFYLSNILHDWPKAKALEIIKNVFKALPSDGSIFINECLLDEGRLTPKHTVLFDLMMHMNFGSQQYTEKEIFQMLTEVGFKNVRRVFQFGYYSVIRADKNNSHQI